MSGNPTQPAFHAGPSNEKHIRVRVSGITGIFHCSAWFYCLASRNMSGVRFEAVQSSLFILKTTWWICYSSTFSSSTPARMKELQRLKAMSAEICKCTLTTWDHLTGWQKCIALALIISLQQWKCRKKNASLLLLQQTNGGRCWERRPAWQR